MCGTAAFSGIRNTRRKVDQNALRPCRTRTRAKKNGVSKSSSCSSKTAATAEFGEKICGMTDLDWTHRIPQCPVYHPTVEEFEDPLIYLRKIAAEASTYGICKIVSPLKASVPAGEVLGDFEFSTYTQPLRLAEWDKDDKIRFLNTERKHTYHSFKSRADEEYFHRFHGRQMHSPAYLEKQFWKEMFSREEGTVEYATNVDGSAFSNDPEDKLGSSKWNLKILPKLSDSVLRLVEHEIPGVTAPMLYIGMLFSMFAWHVEDHYLYSINYHHCGAPKTWYGVPGRAAPKFEKVVLDHVYTPEILFPLDEDGAFEEIAGKTTLFPPSILLQHDVPVFKAVQMPGEFVVTFPKAYHAGFSNGFSCGEAVNFATNDWFIFGAEAGNRYAYLGIPVILPYEELLCRELLHLTKHKGLDFSSKSGDHLSMKKTFLQHVQGLNDALWRLRRGVGADSLISSSKLLPYSHGTVICSTCKRDCYLAFLECGSCLRLHCLFHEIRSFCCPCGGVRTLFLREDLWYIKELTQELEADEMAEDVLRTMKYCKIEDDNQAQRGGGGLYTGSSPHSLEQTKCSPKVEPEKDDLDVTKLNKRGFQEEQQWSLKSFSCKRIRTSRRVKKEGKHA